MRPRHRVDSSCLIVDRALAIGVECFLVNGHVDFAPPNIALRIGMLNDAFVGRERPVFSPEKAIKAPVSAMSHFASPRIASVYSAAGERLRRMSCTVMPYWPRSIDDAWIFPSATGETSRSISVVGMACVPEQGREERRRALATLALVPVNENRETTFFSVSSLFFTRQSCPKSSA